MVCEKKERKGKKERKRRKEKNEENISGGVYGSGGVMVVRVDVVEGEEIVGKQVKSIARLSASESVLMCLFRWPPLRIVRFPVGTTVLMESAWTIARTIGAYVPNVTPRLNRNP